MISMRKFLFKTGEKLMTWSLLIGLLLPVLAERFGLLKLIGGSGERVSLAFAFGIAGFIFFLPITAPMIGIGWILVQLSGMKNAPPNS